MPKAPMTSLYSVSGASGTAPDLTAPSTPASVSLSPGSTSLGSTLIGSWSAVVTVAAVVQASDGSSVTASVTGSGAGPYSVSIASGLTNGRAYSVRLTGTGTDGQVASVTLLVAVQPLADLTPPSTPVPVSLAAGSTSLGSTAVGSWSRSVSVAATVQASAGSPPTATVTGSGAGPYSVSIASGLADGRAYSIRLRGTGSDGQVADVGLAVAVRSATGTLGWTTLADYDFTTIDTGAGTTATSGSLALTVGGSAFLTLEGITGTGVGSITPTNGQGVVISAQGTRAFLVNINWSALGISSVNRRIFSVDWEYEPITITLSSQSNAMMVSSVSGASSDSNFGARMVGNSGPAWAISARSFNAGVAVATTEISTPTTIPSRHSCSLIRIPEGIEVAQSLSALPADPDAHTYVGRRRSLTDSWGTLGGALILGTAPKPAFSLVCASATSEVRVRRLRIMAQGVV